MGENNAELIDYLRRFGLLGSGEVSPSGQTFNAQINYAQPTPLGLLDLGVSGSAVRSKDYKRTGIDSLMAGLNRNGEGFGFGVDTDYRGRNPFFELTYGKSF